MGLARISRVGKSWRVRLYGHPPRYFAWSKYGGEGKALAAAILWRDKHWDGKTRGRKLTLAQTREIQESDEHYKVLAERFGISPNHVHTLRRKAKK